jgi:transcriptional regulator with XRE-family HTH domain
MVKSLEATKTCLAKNVRRLRTKIGMTQEELAEYVGIYRTYLSRIESGQANPSLSVIIALASALETSPDQLLQ